MKSLHVKNADMLSSFAKHGQVILIGVIVAVLALMIIPMPTMMLDFLLALNIVGALTILMVSISITEPMKLSSFPTLLLICTLFRLGLNVSSTRLILSQGEAGQIIKTFGNFVTGGNLLVGVVIFIVLLIIQFLVVAKGSERVAEVAARFTLDALPGKQMSIDADLRAGLITSEIAAQKRKDLIKESRLYGSMDGAMKFVKGDTIAGFVITFINILGGWIIGVCQRGLDISFAAKQYTVLTVGDGLVAQIPALLISLSAGFIVTRVTDPDSDNTLGGEIGKQIFVQPVALLIVSAMSFVLAFVPGFPSALFFLISVGLGTFCMVLIWRSRKDAQELDSINQHRLEIGSESTDLGHASPLLLELGKDMYEKLLQDDRWRVCLNELFPKLKSHLSHRMGIPFPDLKISVNEDMPPEEYIIKIYEIPVDEGFLSPEYCVVRDYDHSLLELELKETEKTAQTVHGTPVMLLQLERQHELRQKGIKVLSPEEMLLLHLARTLKKYASEFVGIQEVRDILNHVELRHPELMREVIPRMLTVHKLTDIIKRLVEESIPVKDFRLILETLSGTNPENKSPVDLTELVRMGLRRVISHRHVNAQNSLSCFLLDPEIEEEISQHIQKNGNESFLTLPPDKLETISRAIGLTYKSHRVAENEVVILTQVELRRYVRKIIESDLPDVAVLSFQELDPKIIIDQRDTISTNYPEVVAVS